MGKMKELFLEEQQLNYEFPDSIDDEFHFTEWNLKSNKVKVKIMVEFYQTHMGRKFYESDFPRLVEAVEKLSKTLEKNNDAGAKEEDSVIKPMSIHALESLFQDVKRICDDYAERNSKIPGVTENENE